jgi:hypothetical protein
MFLRTPNLRAKIEQKNYGKENLQQINAYSENIISLCEKENWQSGSTK